MINQKKARKLRKLLGVKSRSDRTYMTQDGKHHTHKFAAAHHTSLGGASGTVTLSKQSPRSVYQRIKRTSIAARILSAGAAQ